MTLLQVIAMTYSYYNRGQVAPDALVEMYASDLSDLDVRACVEAYGRYRKNPQNKTFPLPAQIRELVKPEEFVAVEVQAREVASRIVGAITKFGWCGAQEAKVFIGAIGWEAVERNGGWMNLCQNVGVSINPATLQAQLRDQLEGTLRYGTKAIESNIKAKPLSQGRKDGEDDLIPLNEVMKALQSGAGGAP